MPSAPRWTGWSPTRPTVLLLEDLHWIDGQSETVIEALTSLAAEPAAAGAADMANRTYAGMAGGARRPANLASLPRRQRGEHAARRSARLGRRPRCAQGPYSSPYRPDPALHRGSGAAAHQPWRRRCRRGKDLLGGARNPADRAGRHRLAHRSAAEGRQGAAATGFGDRAAGVVASAGHGYRHAGGGTAKPSVVAGDPGFPDARPIAWIAGLYVCP